MTIKEALRVAKLRAQDSGLVQAIVLDPLKKRSYTVLTKNTAIVNGMTIVDTVEPVERELNDYPHAGGCVECRKVRRCNLCGMPVKTMCTNGRCHDCHFEICGPGGDTSPGHGFNTDVKTPHFAVELELDHHDERERRQREHEEAEDELKAQYNYLDAGIRKLSGIDR